MNALSSTKLLVIAAASLWAAAIIGRGAAYFEGYRRMAPAEFSNLLVVGLVVFGLVLLAMVALAVWLKRVVNVLRGEVAFAEPVSYRIHLGALAVLCLTGAIALLHPDYNFFLMGYRDRIKHDLQFQQDLLAWADSLDVKRSKVREEHWPKKLLKQRPSFIAAGDVGTLCLVYGSGFGHWGLNVAPQSAEPYSPYDDDFWNMRVSDRISVWVSE